MRIYLFRHGQAGLRSHYDTLSEVGREQARLLGRYLAGQKIAFRAVLSGALERQRETAFEAARAARACALDFPEPAIDPGWNEFDLEGVYREIPPLLCAADPVFARDYEEMTRQAVDPAHNSHRLWMPCDLAIVRAYIDNRFPLSIESWQGFQQRIGANLERLPACEPGEAIAVFTSATPVAVWTALALRSANPNLMRLAGVMYNAAISIFTWRDSELGLFTFNATPHINEARLRTFR